MIIRCLYSVYDSKSKTYSNPFTALNDDEAKRSFFDAVHDNSTSISRHPEDYTIFRIGDFNVATAELTYSKHVSLGKGIEFKVVKEGVVV